MIPGRGGGGGHTGRDPIPWEDHISRFNPGGGGEGGGGITRGGQKNRAYGWSVLAPHKPPNDGVSGPATSTVIQDALPHPVDCRGMQGGGGGGGYIRESKMPGIVCLCATMKECASLPPCMYAYLCVYLCLQHMLICMHANSLHSCMHSWLCAWPPCGPYSLTNFVCYPLCRSSDKNLCSPFPSFILNIAHLNFLKVFM